MTSRQRELFRQVAILLLQAGELLVRVLDTPQPAAKLDQREAVQRLQDHMEQHHGICLKASEWDAAIAAMQSEPGEG